MVGWARSTRISVMGGCTAKGKKLYVDDDTTKTQQLVYKV